jgi:hypothetical protein
LDRCISAFLRNRAAGCRQNKNQDAFHGGVGLLSKPGITLADERRAPIHRLQDSASHCSLRRRDGAMLQHQVTFGKIVFHAFFVFNRLDGKSLQKIDCKGLIAIHVSRKDLARRIFARRDFAD